MFLSNFRKSSLRMESLQTQVTKKQGECGESAREVVLPMDVRTRWNSMIAMLDGVLKVKFNLTLWIVLN
jgi:hypothetical protein